MQPSIRDLGRAAGTLSVPVEHQSGAGSEGRQDRIDDEERGQQGADFQVVSVDGGEGGQPRSSDKQQTRCSFSRERDRLHGLIISSEVCATADY